MDLTLYNFIIDFCSMTKLYLAMSCHSWSDMHLNHTFFVLWLFSSLNDLFFLHCNRYLWRKNSTVAWQKCDSVEWLFNYLFCLSNLILHWVIFQLLLFFLRRWRGIYTPAGFPAKPKNKIPWYFPDQFCWNSLVQN